MIKAVVFDLGGVLVKLAPLSEVFGQSTGEPDTVFWHRWLHSEVVRQFETGQSTLDEFVADIRSELDLSLSHDELIQRHRNFVRGLYPGVSNLLSRLKKTHLLVSLSNNNPVHWPIMMNDYGLENQFDFHFPSHETGLIKPDHNAFENIMSNLNLQSDEMLFIDDNQVNVDAAKNVGIAAVQVKGIEAAEKALKTHNVLVD
jgi:putative hydrolase of the HAD superfamily